MLKSNQEVTLVSRTQPSGSFSLWKFFDAKFTQVAWFQSIIFSTLPLIFLFEVVKDYLK